MRFWKMSAAVAAAACCLASTLSQAAIVITGTRVVYPESSREVNVRLTNVEQSPVLVQAWIDDGNAGASPDEIKVPFVLMPPVFRVEPKKGQTLRVMYTGDDLPKDRESVYWLNVLEIPQSRPWKPSKTCCSSRFARASNCFSARRRWKTGTRRRRAISLRGRSFAMTRASPCCARKIVLLITSR